MIDSVLSSFVLNIQNDLRKSWPGMSQGDFKKNNSNFDNDNTWKYVEDESDIVIYCTY